MTAARQIIEKPFGTLAARWSIVGQPIKFHPDKISDTCIALHNHIISTDAINIPTTRNVPPKFVDTFSISDGIQAGEWRTNSKTSHAIPGVCMDLMQFFQTPPGKVPWQDAVLRCGKLN
uniref:Uncharacterized protein n=1 Tax=Micrurus surinamensis TaxID=129470 RepID=A0A2D4NVX0_MICSU